MTIVKDNLQFEVRDGLSIERLGDELLVLDKENENIHRLNRAAAMVWEGLATGRRPEQIAADIVEIFDTTIDIARRDIDRVTESLVSLKLINSVSTDGFTEE